MEYSKESGSSMLEMYRKENLGFIMKLLPFAPPEMVEYLNNLFL